MTGETPVLKIYLIGLYCPIKLVFLTGSYPIELLPNIKHSLIISLYSILFALQ
jgi:hypothetical protein